MRQASGTGCGQECAHLVGLDGGAKRDRGRVMGSRRAMAAAMCQARGGANVDSKEKRAGKGVRVDRGRRVLEHAGRDAPAAWPLPDETRKIPG